MESKKQVERLTVVRGETLSPLSEGIEFSSSTEISAYLVSGSSHLMLSLPLESHVRVMKAHTHTSEGN